MSSIKQQLQLQQEAQAAEDYIHGCLCKFSDKKIIWLAEKCIEVDNYKRKRK
jgi:hypothetical protein